jgi:hypothetical protein
MYDAPTLGRGYVAIVHEPCRRCLVASSALAVTMAWTPVGNLGNPNTGLLVIAGRLGLGGWLRRCA